ncbi:MAG: MOSC domain-containing protein [Burkholderiales bacterium]|nr:MOSC domain-containing protein [Burkholderiales bacterium]
MTPATTGPATPPGQVLAVAASPAHGFSKPAQACIELLAGLGVAGDAHCGRTVQHRSRVAQDPTQPNLRQVHLLQAELFDALAPRGHRLSPGDIGENITTRGIDLLALPVDTLLHIGAQAVLRLTGLRNPCAQLDGFQPGLMAAVLGRTPDGRLVRKAGVMAVVLAGGRVQPGDTIGLVLPATPHRALERV